MNKRLFVAIGILIVTALLAGGLFLLKSNRNATSITGVPEKKEAVSGMSKEAFDATNKTLARHRITGVKDLDGPYKKVTVSDGTITFSFEVPDQWFTETRNSGEVEMNEEELREYLATNYDGDIKAAQVCNDQVFEYEGKTTTENICYKPHSDYSGYDWETLRAMSYAEMEAVMASKKSEYTPGVPNATVSLSHKIWYTDIGWDQVNFYLVDKDEALRGIAVSKKSQQEHLEIQDSRWRDKYEVKWESRKIDERDTMVSLSPKEYFPDTGEYHVTKGGTGGSNYYVDLGDSMLIIWKEAYVEGKFEEGFQRILDTLIFHE